MQININVERIANKEVDKIVDVLGVSDRVDSDSRKVLVNQFIDNFTEDADSLEHLVESLLLKNLDETTSNMISTAKQLSKLFGGINND